MRQHTAAKIILGIIGAACVACAALFADFSMGSSIAGLVFKILACVFIALLFLLVITKYEIILEFPKELIQHRKLLFQLSKNDFKTKFAGSYLGITWAFVQPVVTVVLYWFVFEKGLKSGANLQVPFVLWLIAGLIPWLFFSDALNGGTAALIDYRYLVKKVVFKIDILPVVKIISAIFVHLFFVVFMLVLYACYGYFPNLYTIQLIYYIFCNLILVIGLSYITSAVVCFIRDLSQIIGIVLQIGTWMTPILWVFADMDLPAWLKTIFMANPLFYIVQGFRDSLVDKVWFFERPGLTIYFWLFTLFVLFGGMILFKKLKPHFADVL